MTRSQEACLGTYSVLLFDGKSQGIDKFSSFRAVRNWNAASFEPAWPYGLFPPIAPPRERGGS
jgi:hypothetical protein